MKLKALRLAHVGPFADPIALEDLSGRLDVLIGPNEHGKSTLLRALRAALFERHTADTKNIDALRPYSGEHPLVEADVEIGGRLLRIRKHFKRRTKGSIAKLIDVSAGRTLADGEAAEDQIGTLLGVRDGAAASIGLLWLSQRDALQPVKPDAHAATTLHEVIAREVEATASGDGARDLLTRVESRLEELKGAKSLRPPKGKPFANALEAKELATEQLAAAIAARDLTEANRQSIAERRLLLATFRSPGHMAALAAAIEASRSALDAGRSAADKLAKIAAECRLAETEHRDASAARQNLASQIIERQSLLTSLASGEAALKRQSAEREAMQRQATAARTEHETRIRALKATRSAVETALRAESSRNDRAELAKLTATAAAIAGQIEATARTGKAIAAIGLTATMLADIERADRALAEIEAQCSASNPTVSLDLAAGAESRVRIGGALLMDARTFTVDSATMIDIAGIGRITIAPGAGEDREALLARREGARSKLAQLLALAGGGTIEAMRAKDAERRQLDTALGEHRARMAALAPNGPAEIETRIASLSVRISDSGPVVATQEPIAQLVARRTALEQATEVAAARTAELDRQLRTAELAEQKVSDQHGRAVERMSGLTKSMPAEADVELKRLAAMESTAETHANTLIRERRAFQEAAPSPEQLAALTLAHDKAIAAQQHNQRQGSEIEGQLRELEGRVAQAAGEGSGEAVDELAGEVARLDADIARFTRDRDALMLLAETLALTLAETRTAYLRPVLDRLHGLLPMVMPGARLDLGDGFSVNALFRSDRNEPLDRLSGGTQEQIAILVRLAFARLLADGGRSAPLILDDPLVFADDERLERMFAALATAGSAHQVFVLSCHAASFGPLVERHGGRRLALVPWHDAPPR